MGFLFLFFWWSGDETGLVLFAAVGNQEAGVTGMAHHAQLNSLNGSNSNEIMSRQHSVETEQTVQTSGTGADYPWGLVVRHALNFRERNSNGTGWSAAR